MIKPVEVNNNNNNNNYNNNNNNYNNNNSNNNSLDKKIAVTEPIISKDFVNSNNWALSQVDG